MPAMADFRLAFAAGDLSPERPERPSAGRPTTGLDRAASAPVAPVVGDDARAAVLDHHQTAPAGAIEAAHAAKPGLAHVGDH